jgi:hypothetical protein
LNHFLNEFFLKIKTENCIEIWRRSWCYWNALGKSDLIKFISQFSELRCGRYQFLSEILLPEIQTNCKQIRFSKEKWPTAQTTLVCRMFRNSPKTLHFFAMVPAGVGAAG